jgi:hypothetical protein
MTKRILYVTGLFIGFMVMVGSDVVGWLIERCLSHD